jgi:hypothetical protein
MRLGRGHSKNYQGIWEYLACAREPVKVGSWLSGRHPTKVTVESSYTLDIGRLLRTGALVPGAVTSGSIVWSIAATGNKQATIGYEAHMADPAGAYVRLHYTVNGAAQDYRVGLRRAPCRLGGFRWWWQCPQTGCDAAKLYLPPGATVFASRRAYRMAYISERGGAIDRSHRRQARLYAKLGKDYVVFDECPPLRPKGMHRRTYERLEAQIMQAVDRHEHIFTLGALRFLARDPEIGGRLGINGK